MKTQLLTIGLVCLFVQSWLVAPTAADDNWPQWRGPGWASLSGSSNVPTNLDLEKNLLWRVAMPGPAGSSPIVWNDTIFVTSADGDNLVLIALNLQGAEQWRQKLDGENRTIRMDNANYASPSPMTDGTHVWATSAAGVLHCFTFDGKPVWKKDLQEVYGNFDIQFGMSTTPILDNGRIYHQLIHGSMRDASPSVGWVLAFDAKTGDEIWKIKRETEAIAENKHSYTSPVIYRDDERAFLITHGGDYAIGHDLDTGAELWRVGGLNPKATYNSFLRFVSSPAVHPGMIVIPSAKNGPVYALRPEKLSGDMGDMSEHADAFHWVLDRGTPDVSTPVIDAERKLVYLCNEKGLLHVVQMETGEVPYVERMFADKHRSTPVIAGDVYFLTARNGEVLVIQRGENPQVVSRIALEEETTASPAISGGRLFIRTFEALYAFGDK